jgi:hypothetical protein
MRNLGIVSKAEFERLLMERKAFVPEAYPPGYFDEEPFEAVSSKLHTGSEGGLPVPGMMGSAPGSGGPAV